MFSNCVCVSVRFEYVWLIRCIFELCLVAPVGSNFFPFWSRSYSAILWGRGAGETRTLVFRVRVGDFKH